MQPQQPAYAQVAPAPPPKRRDDSRHVLNVATQALTCVCCTPLAWCCGYALLGADWCGEGEAECPPPQAVPMGRVVVPAPQQPQAVPVALGLGQRGLVSVPALMLR